MGYPFLQVIVVTGPLQLDPELRDRAKAVARQSEAMFAATDEWPDVYVADREPEEWVDRLYGLWQAGPDAWPQDRFSRPNPDAAGRRMFIAGGTHWSSSGDPYEGEAYQTLVACESLGIFELLGIK